MKASEAKTISDCNQNTSMNIELEAIFEKIKQACNEGKYNLTITSDEDNCILIRRLQELGYLAYVTGPDYNSISISW